MYQFAPFLLFIAFVLLAMLPPPPRRPPTPEWSILPIHSRTALSSSPYCVKCIISLQLTNVNYNKPQNPSIRIQPLMYRQPLSASPLPLPVVDLKEECSYSSSVSFLLNVTPSSNRRYSQPHRGATAAPLMPLSQPDPPTGSKLPSGVARNS